MINQGLVFYQQVCMFSALAWIFLYWIPKHEKMLWSHVTVVAWQLIVKKEKLLDNFFKMEYR